MRTNIALGRVIVGGVAAALFAFACSDDNGGGNEPNEAGTGGSGATSTGGKGTSTGGASSGGKGTGGTTTGGSAGMKQTGGSKNMEAGTPDGGDGGAQELSLCGGKTGDALIECGKYIVTVVDACGDCHTPRLQTGAPDLTKILAGNPTFADIDPTDDAKGNIPTPNLTTLQKNKWTEQEIMDAVLDGKVSAAHGGKGLFPIMPYLTFHNMAKIDAQAIADYLLSLTPITNDIPARQPLPAPDAAFPTATVNLADIPDPVIAKTDPSYKDALFGKYLAAQVGVCLDCHTERKADGTVDMARAFGGGETFVVGGPFGTVTSANITPDTTSGLGVGTWTPGLIKTLLKTGKTDTGGSICPPMPVGPMGAFGGLTDEHALAIGAYITHLPAISNGFDGGRFPFCVPPAGPPPTDGGSDSSSKDSGGD